MTSTGEGTWELVDLLGRSMGCIVATSTGQFTIEPEGNSLETMAGINLGPYQSLDAALDEIEKRTRGVCRRNAADQS